MDILFGGIETEDGNLFCSGGTGDRTPSNGSDDSPRSAGRATRGSGKDQVVDSPPPKRPRSVEYYVKQISESMLERSRNESSSKSLDRNELKELLRIVEEDGVSQGSELYYIAAELFRSPDQWVALKLSNSKKCYKNFRLTPAAFHKLHTTLVAHHGLQSTSQCESIEALGMFLWACGTNQSQRQISEQFRRSQDTVSRKFGEVLEAMISFAHTIIKPRDRRFRNVHPKLQRFSPYFDGCIGVIDGTHIPVTVNDRAHDDFVNRKGFTSQNVMAVCDMDMRFTFVATGKRGAAHDMAVFREAVNNSSQFPHPPRGKYYLVDSGYQLREGYMAPYRMSRYHLSEFEDKGPENLYELFNYYHSSLRNVVERSFGVLKNKWQILKGIPLYSMEKQSKIIVACFALHNFAIDNNEPEIDVRGGCVGSLRAPSAQGWLEATWNDNISTVRDWIAAGLYSLV